MNMRSFHPRAAAYELDDHAFQPFFTSNSNDDPAGQTFAQRFGSAVALPRPCTRALGVDFAAVDEHLYLHRVLDDGANPAGGLHEETRCGQRALVIFLWRRSC